MPSPGPKGELHALLLGTEDLIHTEQFWITPAFSFTCKEITKNYLHRDDSIKLEIKPKLWS